MNIDQDQTPEAVDETLDTEGRELLSELVGCTPEEVAPNLAQALAGCSPEKASQAAELLIAVAGAVGSLADAFADGELDPDESRDLRAVSGEAVSDLTDLVQLLLPEGEDVELQEEVEIDG